jgi:hypothetical protein
MKKESKLDNAGLIREQRYRTEFWCRNTDAGLKQLTTGRIADAGLTFLRNSDIPAFTNDFSISYSKNNTISSCLWTCRVCPCPLPAVWTCRVHPFLPPAVWRYGNKGSQSGTGLLRYRTDTQDAGMPMLAASTSMPMHSYEKNTVCRGNDDTIFVFSKPHCFYSSTYVYTTYIHYTLYVRKCTYILWMKRPPVDM